MQFFHDQPVQNGRILQPAAVVSLEQVAHDVATRYDIGLQPDETGTGIRSPDGLSRQHAADDIGFAIMALGHDLPDLFLPRVVVADGKGHQLLQAHPILLIDFKQAVGHGHQTQALLDNSSCHEERSGDFLLGHAFFQHVTEGAKLVQRVQGQPLDVLGQRVILGENGRSGFAHDTGHGRGLRQFLLLHQQFKGTEAPSAGRDFVSAGLGPFAIKDRTDVQALQ
ncbi:hypothetical protein GLUCOINTEAF2_0204244 [Komagataeibacter intermedius AF2]|uniref:Uncharacterized protein n=1 Tax=Komagataeibacter intermedius AF2 TaxID=1458464 RepID=A0A0N1N4R4_9PROT|nr:hypothetical protein GLUCOINTEAF2_0204244 [Komagataeibacter intermedius AF2]